MILDDTLLFSDDQDLAAVASTIVSTNVINFGVDRNMGIGVPIPLLVQVTEDFASGGAATLQVVIDTDDNEGMASAERVFSSQVIALGDLVAGYKIPMTNYMPNENEQFMRLSYIIGTATTTAGKVTAGISAGNQNSFSGK